MKTIQKLFVSLLVIVAFASCGSRDADNSEPVVSFNPEDSESVNALMGFLISNDIIMPSMLRCDKIHGQSGLHTFDCLKDGCEISCDYLQDSLSPYFFTELNCMSGTMGNDIYLLKKTENAFEILFNECGTIDQDLGPDTLVNNFRVLYYEQDSKAYRIVFNGEKFVSEMLTTDPDDLCAK